MKISLYTLYLWISVENTLCFNLPKTWNKVTIPFKDKARNWFIDRAEKSNIPWRDLRDKYQDPEVHSSLIINKQNVENRDVMYPDYYLKPFHGYDEGNLNWLAAEENEAATLNIASGYWPDADVDDAQLWMRSNTTTHVANYLSGYNSNILNPRDHQHRDYTNPRNILDIGCSVGISSEFYQKQFPNAKVTGVDLSPYFLAVAAWRSELRDKNSRVIEYIHGNAEQLNFMNGSQSLVTCNYLFHEVPFAATKNILQEIYRVLEPHGIISITDIEPSVINQNKNGLLTPFRRWMFEVTEPHIFSYYENDMRELLFQCGFVNIVKARNDPVNSVWIAKKALL